MEKSFRPPAVPLVAVDPYFSIWSMTDRLYDDDTRHWTGAAHPLFGAVVIDGKPYRFMGTHRNMNNPVLNSGIYNLFNIIPQKKVIVNPLSTIYTFEGYGISLVTAFTTPLVPTDLDLLSSPASFISFKIESLDGHSHAVRIFISMSPLVCVNSGEQEVCWNVHSDSKALNSLRVGTTEQKILGKAGDDLRIDWGYAYLAAPRQENITLQSFFAFSWEFSDYLNKNTPSACKNSGQSPANNAPSSCIDMDLGTINAKPGRLSSAFLMLGYDDIYSIEYFGKHLRPYWARNGLTIDTILSKSSSEHARIIAQCDAFDNDLLKEATAAGGPHYSDICALAYRQVIAAHKLVADENNNALFFSKECFSNGCMATTDVSFPSCPQLLLYNTELVKGMLRPVFKFALSDKWPYAFAPHDVGCYPAANGQVYGGSPEKGYELKWQMPIEGSAGMLIMTAAVSIIEDKADFASQNWDLLTKWYGYLLESGADPGEQLCTDDFAGHLAHNANLSIKACIGMAAYSILCGMTKRLDESKLAMSEAKKAANAWEKSAFDGDHYRLAFDSPGTWSLKYNLIWDKLFGTNLFSPEVYNKECAWYKRQMLTYGVPLDSRDTYTKTDWLVWCASMEEKKTDFEKWMLPLWNSLHETVNRVPMTDWYYSDTAAQRGFQNRSVLGGVFSRLLLERGVVRTGSAD